MKNHIVLLVLLLVSFHSVCKCEKKVNKIQQIEKLEELSIEDLHENITKSLVKCLTARSEYFSEESAKIANKTILREMAIAEPLITEYAKRKISDKKATELLTKSCHNGIILQKKLDKIEAKIDPDVRDKFYFHVSESLRKMYLLSIRFGSITRGDLSPAAIKSIQEKLVKTERLK